MSAAREWNEARALLEQLAPRLLRLSALLQTVLDDPPYPVQTVDALPFLGNVRRLAFDLNCCASTAALMPECPVPAAIPVAREATS